MKRLLRKAETSLGELVNVVPDVKLGYSIKEVIRDIFPEEFADFAESKGCSHADQLLNMTNENFAYTLGMEAFKHLNKAEDLYRELKEAYGLSGSFDEEIKNYLNGKVDKLDTFANIDDLNKDVLKLISEASDWADDNM